MAEVYVPMGPMGGAGRLAIQQCSRMPDPRRGFGFQSRRRPGGGVGYENLIV